MTEQSKLDLAHPAPIPAAWPLGLRIHGPLKIGVLSDTHGIWRPQIAEIFQDVREILHAGDVGSLEVLERLGEIAPVTAVRGNVDNSETASLPGEVEKEIGGLRFLIRHVGAGVEDASADLRKLLIAGRIDVFVFGHSHKTYCRRLESTLFFNPGAAGPRRFSTPLSVATLEILSGVLSWQFRELS